MASQKGLIGAADLMAELQSDPVWIAQDAARESKRQAAEQRFRTEEEPMIADLAKAGFTVGSVWDLVNTTDNYTAAIPVLLDHLKCSYHERIRNGIIRALTVKEARGIAGGDVLRELLHEKNDENRWALANALTVVGDKNQVTTIEALVDDPRFADVSERLKEALKNLKR